MYGALDFNKRTFSRAVWNGQYKLVRWFSPLEYGNPTTLDELLVACDVTLHDFVNASGEMENIGYPDHPCHDPVLVERMLKKRHALIEHETGEDRPTFDLELGIREVKYRVKER